MKSIQIYIATYNRPNMVINAIDSILCQTLKDYELIVSDNSTNDLTELSIKKTYPHPNFTYVKRIPPVEGVEHFNLILSEIKSDYFMVFHDDDIMHPTMLECLYTQFKMNNSCIAIGGNAWVINENKKRRKFINLTKGCRIQSIDEMCERYLNNLTVPFPSYLYKKEVSEKAYLNKNNGGKYSDSAFIISLLDLGDIAFVSEPLMDYYEHSGQDSAAWAFNDRIAQIRFITANSRFTSNSSAIKNFRIVNIYSELYFRGFKNITFSSFLKYSRLFLKYSPFIIFPKFVIKKLLKKSFSYD